MSPGTRYWAICFLSILTLPYLARAQEACGSLRNAYGPYDYRTEKAKLEIVEGAHFLPHVENLSRGNTSSTPGADIDYTLRASPNHHRALLAMIKLADKEKRDKPVGSHYSVICWLVRAERFAPDDAMVKTLYGSYLLKKGKTEAGVQKLEEALQMAGDNANVHYNLGLAYVELKEYDKALASAHKAYQLGFQLPGLRNKLENLGKWKEPPPAMTARDEKSSQDAGSIAEPPAKE